MAAHVILALDGIDRTAALALAAKVAGRVFALKIHDLLLREGPGIIAALRRHAPVWVDLKFHDIPATVGKEVERLVEAGADFCTVHASGGKAMVEAAVAAGGRERGFAVTALTSLDEHERRAIYGGAPVTLVPQLARLPAAAGAGRSG